MSGDDGSGVARSEPRSSGIDISDGVADPWTYIHNRTSSENNSRGENKGGRSSERAYTGRGEEAAWLVMQALAGEDLRAVEEMEEAGHAALVHGPLVVLRAHRHHLLHLPSCSSSPLSCFVSSTPPLFLWV